MTTKSTPMSYREHKAVIDAAPDLLAALRLLHAECRAGSPSLLALEFADKAIGQVDKVKLIYELDDLGRDIHPVQAGKGQV